MNQPKLSLIAIATLSALLTGCGDADTTIIERESIVEAPADPNPGHGHDGDIVIESLGRLAVESAQSMTVSILDLDDGDVLDDFALAHEGSRLAASPDYRYAVISARDEDVIQFIDGGMWREDHVDHLHDYEQAPEYSDFSITGSRPTHIDSNDGKMAVFFDGDSEAGVPASVQVLTDQDITSENDTLASVNYTMSMHGVAKPMGDLLLSTLRRSDDESTSSFKTLPDQVGVFHLHDGEYELEQTLEHTCPDLHGAAVNHEHFVFGCSDGVLVAHAHGEEFESAKIDNIDALNGTRIGSVFGHEDSPLFFGVGRNRQTNELAMVSINPEAGTMEAIEWTSEATPHAFAASYDGEKFAVLDNQGVITKFELHTHDGELELELEGSLVISNEDLSQMPEGHNFSMAMSPNGDDLYVADPIAQHVLHINLESLTIIDDFELDVIPSGIVWLGIKESDHDH